MKRHRTLVIAVVVAMLLAATVAWAQPASQPGKKPMGVVQRTEVTEHQVVSGDTLWAWPNSITPTRGNGR
jgi:hypothetical protein